MSEFTSTIAAISTPPGKGGVAVIRLSGPEAFEIAARVFVPRGRRTPYDTPRTAIYGDLLEGGSVVDDGIAVAFPAPHSYTGEDTVELSCHGGVLITRTVLEALLVAGATPAAPGEFTRRAYLSGRLGLSEVEAIGTLLEAKSTAQVHLSAARGLLSGEIAELYREMLTLISNAEALIDFPEEDLTEIPEEEFLARLEKVLQRITALAASYRTGRAVAEGIRTVIVGRPNVGKSSLYNLLVGEEAAIVSDIPGTTRDILERTVPLGRVLLRLADTAGLRESGDRIESIGVDRARAAAAEADLILAVFDASMPLSEEDYALFSLAARPDAVRIALLNKSDLPTRLEVSELDGRFDAILPFSAKCGDKAPLEGELDRLFTDGSLVIGDAPIVASARQYAALCHARDALLGAVEAMRAGLPADMMLCDLGAAMAALGEVDGRTVNEEIVDEIFHHFCVGK